MGQVIFSKECHIFKQKTNKYYENRIQRTF